MKKKCLIALLLAMVLLWARYARYMLPGSRTE